jgi:hypothetical protein
MPYRIIKRDGKFAVQTKTTGKTHGYTTKPKAQAQMRLLSFLSQGGRR